MSITASCGNCGKTYQAPDRMAGKSVRCKQCGEVFRIDSGDAGLDLDALSSSVSDEEFPTHQGTHQGARQATAVGGPALDEHGRPSIERPDDVEAFTVRGYGAGGPRSNYRFRYPGAKAVDQLLPWALVVLAFTLVGNASMTNEAEVFTSPTTGVGISRMAVLFAAYLFVVFPASHIALKMASTKMRFSLPGSALWRSFAAFSPVLMMGGWLFIKSGGSGVPLAMGLAVGTALAIGAVAVLFRVFVNEVPTVAAYAAVGAIGSSVFAALAIVAINMIGVALAGVDKNPTLFVSPIAIGLPWIDATKTPVAIAPKKPSTVTPTNPSATTTGTTPPVAPVAPVLPPSPLQSMPLPKPEGNQPQLLSELQSAPVPPGFDEVVLTPVLSNAMAIMRYPSGGSVEVWNNSTFTQPTTAKGHSFDRNQGALVVNTTGRHVFRMVRTPYDRIEEITLGNLGAAEPIRLVGAASNRSVLGFVTENDIIIRSGDVGGIAFERYNVATGSQTYGPKVFRSGANREGESAPPGILVDLRPNTVRMLPDGSGVLVAGREASVASNSSQLLLYAMDHFDQPISTRDVPFNSQLPLCPLGMAVRSNGKVALLLDASSEGYLTIWNMRDTIVDGKPMPGSKKAIRDTKLGVLSDMRPTGWDDSIDPLLWIDDDTLLIYGSRVFDTRTGRWLGTLNIPSVIGQYPAGDGSILLLQSSNRLNSLLRATFDPNGLAKARGM
jgi:hypothetical protein